MSAILVFLPMVGGVGGGGGDDFFFSTQLNSSYS